MSDYQPKWRRPIGEVFRKTAHGPVRFCVQRGIHPNTVSYSSFVAAAAAGLCFWLSSHAAWLLIPAALFCYLRLWFNMLDGMVALASGKASRSGEIVNELPDRFSDVAIFVGVGHSGWCQPLLGYWVAIFALLVAYVGVLGQAIGVQREFSGVMAKQWRMVTLSIGAFLTLALYWGSQPTEIGGLSVLDWTLILIIAGCVQTIWIRLKRILRSLAAEEKAASVTGKEAERAG